MEDPQTLDLMDGLSEDEQEQLRRVSSDQTLMNLYGLVGRSRFLGWEALSGAMVAAVIDRYGRIEAVSTTEKPTMTLRAVFHPIWQRAIRN